LIEEAIKDFKSALENFKDSDAFDEDIKVEMDFLSDQFVATFKQHHIGV
jgi:hypothetical protein